MPADLSTADFSVSSTSPEEANQPCAQISLSIAAAVEPSEILPPEVARHIEQCLRCQADVVRHRRIHRTMASMSDDVIVPGDEAVENLLEALRPGATVHRIHEPSRRKAYLSGIAAAATAGAAGALVIASRLSRTRLAS